MTAEGNLFVSPDSVPIVTDSSPDDLRKIAWARESELISQRTKPITRQFVTAREMWEGDGRISSLAKAWETVNNAILKTTDMVAEENGTVADENAMQVCRAAAMVQSCKSTENLVDALVQKGADVAAYTAVNTIHSTLPVTLQVDGVSIRRIAEQDTRHKLPLSRLLTFFMETQQFDRKGVPQEIIEANREGLTSDFPETIASGAVETNGMAISLLNMALGIREDAYKEAKKKVPTTVPVADKLLKETKIFHDRLQETVVDPESDEFVALKNTVQRYVGADASRQAILIHLFTFGSPNKMQKLYRAALAQVGHEQHGDFYKKFSDMLRIYTDAISDFGKVYTKDDVEEVFTPTEIPATDPVPTIADYRQTIASTIAKRPLEKKAYEVVPDSIDWGELTEPTSATITFGEATPMQFRVELQYERGEEQATIRVVVDAKKQKFEWNYLEDPESAAMQPFAAATKRVTMAVLQHVSEVVRAEREAKAPKPLQKGVAASVVQRLGPKEPKVRPEPEMVETPRKRRRQEVNPMAVYEEAAQLNAEGIAKTIVVPSEEALRTRMSGISPADQDMILQRIADYNERGVGNFKMLAGQTEDGDKLYVLKIKGFRALLRELGSEEGHRRFEIEDIRNRRDVYKKLKRSGFA